MMSLKSRWFLYDELLDSIPPNAIVKNFCYGRHWLMLESDQGGIGMAQHFTPTPIPLNVINKKYDFIGASLSKVATRLKSWDFSEASIGLAALNAANNTMALSRGLNPNCDAFDFFLDETSGKKVSVIGHFPYLNKLRGHCDLSILERNPRSGDLPDTAAEYILPEQDFVYITGTTFINKTITRLLELSSKAVVCMVGPSTPMNHILFSYGIKSLSGLIIQDYNTAANAIMGDNCESIFLKGSVKVNLLNEA